MSLKQFLMSNLYRISNVLKNVWVEVAMADDRNLLIGNYFSPHITVDIIKIYSNF
jgi:hypothetical protein